MLSFDISAIGVLWLVSMTVIVEYEPRSFVSCEGRMPYGQAVSNIMSNVLISALLDAERQEH